MDQELLNILVCPACGSALRDKGSALECTACKKNFPIENGIPALMGEPPVIVRPQPAPIEKTYTSRPPTDRPRSDRPRSDRGHSDRPRSDRGPSGRGPSRGGSDRGPSGRGPRPKGR